MANTKISALTADTAPTADDLVVTVNDPGGTPATRKATITNFTKAIPAVIGDSGSGGTKGLVPAPGAGDAAAGKFLKADGTFAVPSGSAPGGSAGGDLSGTYPNPAVIKTSLTAAHGSDDTWTGTTISGLNAGATIAQWEAVYLGGSSTWLLADANGSGTYPARGLATAAYSSTDPATILVLGTVRNDAWNWTPGGAIYLSATAGGLTQTPPATSGDKVQQVGFALTADIAFFDFNSTYLTVT